jgi:integrase
MARKQVKITIGHDMNGKPIRKSFNHPTSKRKAQAMANEYLESLKAGTVVDDKMLFANWAEIWLETYVIGVSSTTYSATYKNTVKKHLVPHFGQARVCDIRPVDIQRFFNKNSDKSYSLLHKCDFILKGIFEQAVDNDIIYKNPHKNIKIPSGKAPAPRTAYTAEQERIHLDFCKTHKYGLLAMLPLKTSISRSEVAALMWTDIDQEEKTIHIQRGMNQHGEIGNVKTKHRKRYVPYDDELADMIKSYPKAGMYLFCDKSGPVGVDRIDRLYRKFRNDLLTAYPDMPKLTYHELRHTYATRLNENKVPDNTIALLMGHGKDSKITNEVYIHQNMAHIKTTLGLVKTVEENDMSSKCPQNR